MLLHVVSTLSSFRLWMVNIELRFFFCSCWSWERTYSISRGRLRIPTWRLRISTPRLWISTWWFWISTWWFWIQTRGFCYWIWIRCTCRFQYTWHHWFIWSWNWTHSRSSWYCCSSSWYRRSCCLKKSSNQCRLIYLNFCILIFVILDEYVCTYSMKFSGRTSEKYVDNGIRYTIIDE